MNSKPALILYTISVIGYIAAVFFQNDSLALLTKPVILPSILFYYWQEANGKVNGNYVVLIVLSFIADMMILIDFDTSFLYVVILSLLVYLLYLRDLVDYLVVHRLKINRRSFMLVFLISLFLFIYLLVNCLDLLIESGARYIYLLGFYGVVLVAIGAISVLNYVLNSVKTTFFMLLTSLCFIISDIFFIMRDYYDQIPIFEYVNSLSQVLSYYYLTKFYLSKPRNVL